MTFEYEDTPQGDENCHEYKNGVTKEEPDIFSAKIFVENLLEYGSKVACDNSIEEFNNEGIPKCYNARKYKRGQDFFHKYIFAHSFCKLFGLIVTISVPTILKVLIMTKRSGTLMTAYRRYMTTVLYVELWYSSELSANSKSMRVMKRVRNLHNAASLKSRGLDKPRITQTDMALTQFGFIGFCLTRREFLGLYGATKEELEGFVHIWKVVGTFLGIQERFNICRDSLEETVEICEELIRRVYRPILEKRDEDFLEMSSYLIKGMWHTYPYLNHRVYLTFLYDLLKPKESLKGDIVSNSDQYFKLNFIENFFYRAILIFNSLMRFNILRWYYNFEHRVQTWLLGWFPVLAVYSFGYKNAIVRIEDKLIKEQ